MSHEEPLGPADSSAVSLSWWESLSGAGWLPPPGGSGSRTTADVCRGFLQAALDRLGCRLATAWSVDPVNRRLILVEVRGAKREALTNKGLDCAAVFSGTTIERKRVTVFPDLTRPDELGRTFSHPDLIPKLGLTQMVSIPLINTSNMNQVLQVINLFPAPGAPLLKIGEAQLDRMAEDLVARVETALQERCDRYANRLGIELSKVQKPTAGRLCTTLARLVRRAVGCDRVDVFLEQADTQAIAFQAAADLTDPPPAPATGPLAEISWRTNRECLRPDTAKPGAAAGPSAMVVPVRNLNGQAKGIICCTNRPRKDAPGPAVPFAYDDVAVVEAVGGAFLPHLVILLAEQRRAASLDRLVHELRVPLVAFRAVLERLQGEAQRNGYVFQYPHFNEIDIYCDIMDRQFKELDMTRTVAPRISLDPRLSYLVNSIIAPAKRFLSPLLSKHRFSPGQLEFKCLDAYRLWVDVGLMTQVVFNLLENAIKYYQGPPEKFRIVIEGEPAEDEFVIVFRDWGIGVPEGLEKRIFESGFRAPDAYKYNVTGDGLGLFLAREIVRHHGGKLTLRQRSNPTEFVIRLPKGLAHSPPTDEPCPEEES
jgi:hypothetical protein